MRTLILFDRRTTFVLELLADGNGGILTTPLAKAKVVVI